MLRRTDLFPTPIWTADLDDFESDLPQMLKIARRTLQESPAPGELFNQSKAVLQDDSDPVWVKYFRTLAEIMESILSREVPPQYSFDRAFLRSWVLEIDSPDQFDQTGTTLNALHSHVPAVLSSVLYLQVPENLIDARTGGTTFRDPNSVNTRPYARSEFHVSAAPLRLVVFPSFLEHMPERPERGIDLHPTRIIVSTDLRVQLS